MPVITLLRGLPGCGKTTYALSNLRHDTLIEADNYLYTAEGKYLWTPERVVQAHTQAQAELVQALAEGKSVVVANTFSRHWEIESYLSLAPAHYTRVVIDLFDGGGLTDEILGARNVHGVPAEKIAAMRARWEPLPPYACRDGKGR